MVILSENKCIKEKYISVVSENVTNVAQLLENCVTEEGCKLLLFAN